MAHNLQKAPSPNAGKRSRPLDGACRTSRVRGSPNLRPFLQKT